MVTIHRAFGFRFVLYANDHTPPHVHLIGQGGAAKVILQPDKTVRLDWSIGIARNDLRRLLQEVATRHGDLMTQWERLHDE